jgi:hypothetical protein
VLAFCRQTDRSRGFGAQLLANYATNEFAIMISVRLEPPWTVLIDQRLKLLINFGQMQLGLPQLFLKLHYLIKSNFTLD